MCAEQVLGAVKRRAWRIAPALTSSQRTRPGRIGSPAASALVQPAGLSAFERRSQMAPEPPCHWPPDFEAWKISYRTQSSVSQDSRWASLPPSIFGLDGIGYGPGSDSSSYWKPTV